MLEQTSRTHHLLLRGHLSAGDAGVAAAKGFHSLPDLHHYRSVVVAAAAAVAVVVAAAAVAVVASTARWLVVVAAEAHLASVCLDDVAVEQTWIEEKKRRERRERRGKAVRRANQRWIPLFGSI